MHHLRYYFNGLFVRYLKHRELDDLYISSFIKNLSQSFISLFIPIYLISLGFNLQKIMIFYSILFLFLLLFYPPSLKLGSIIGIKKVMAIGTLLWIPGYLLLAEMSAGFPYYIVAILFGVANAVYWGCFHVEFTKSAETNKEAKDLSIYKILLIITSVLGPLIGAYIIFLTSYSTLFIVASILAFISIIPLFLTKDIYVPKEKLNLKSIFSVDKKIKVLGYALEGFLAVIEEILWPLFIYIVLNDILALGRIFSFAALIIAFLIAEIGRIADKYPKKVFEASVLTYAPLWIIRIFANAPFLFFIINFITNFLGTTVSISMNRLAYHQAETSKKIMSYFILREIGLTLGRIVIIALILLIMDIPTIFIITAFITLFYLLVAKKA